MKTIVFAISAVILLSLLVMAVPAQAGIADRIKFTRGVDQYVPVAAGSWGTAMIKVPRGIYESTYTLNRQAFLSTLPSAVIPEPYQPTPEELQARYGNILNNHVPIYGFLNPSAWFIYE